MKIIAKSFERYNGGVKVKRLYGSSTVTRFYVYYEGSPASDWKIVEGFGPTPGDRRTDAIRRSGLQTSDRDRNRTKRRNTSRDQTLHHKYGGVRMCPCSGETRYPRMVTYDPEEHRDRTRRRSRRRTKRRSARRRR